MNRDCCLGRAALLLLQGAGCACKLFRVTVQQLHLATAAEMLQGCSGSTCVGLRAVTTSWQRDNGKTCRESEAGPAEPRNKACIFTRKGYFSPKQLPKDCKGFFDMGFLKPGEDVFLEKLFETNRNLLCILQTYWIC